MDKTEKLIEAIEHPENFSEEELATLASDPETAETYRLLCLVRGEGAAPEFLSGEEVDERWRSFARSHTPSVPFLRRMSGRVAIWGAVAVISVSALAVGIGVSSRRGNPSQTGRPAETAATSQEAVRRSSPSDTIQVASERIVFDNESLYDIITRIAPVYGIKTVFKSDNAKEVRLYFAWSNSMPIEEVVSQLNSFERIDITLSDNTLTIL